MSETGKFDSISTNNKVDLLWFVRSLKVNELQIQIHPHKISNWIGFTLKIVLALNETHKRWKWLYISHRARHN